MKMNIKNKFDGKVLLTAKELMYGKLYRSTNKSRIIDSLFTVTNNGNLIWFCSDNDGVRENYTPNGAEFYEVFTSFTIES